MDKYIINITFCLEKNCTAEWYTWLKTDFLPMLDTYEGLSEPQLVHVKIHQEETESYSLQHKATPQAVQAWQTEWANNARTAAEQRFGQRILLFDTILQILPL